MADQVDETLKKKLTFKKFTNRGVDLDQLLDMPNYQLGELMYSRARRRKPMAFIKKLRKAKKEKPPNEKPEIVNIHLGNMIIVLEMTASIIGVRNSEDFSRLRSSLR